MSALQFLSTLLQSGIENSSIEHTDRSGIDSLLATMQATAKGRKGFSVPESLQFEAVKRFWPNQEASTFRDVYLLSWALCIPHRDDGECVMESASHLEQVLGYVDQYTGNPPAFRRCYQGLVKGYFQYNYGNRKDTFLAAARRNWPLLRDYLYDRNQLIQTERGNPDWVQAAQENRGLFTRDPCALYVDALLRGDCSVVRHMCDQLQISQTSWFQERLVMGQVHKAISMKDGDFVQLLPKLLGMEMFVENHVLRDSAMRLLLDRYSSIPGRPLHPQLRDFSVAWWGNPWLPSNATSWGGVTDDARTMVADWLKDELIEAFFTKLADDGLADPRRMNFWKRYVKAMRHIEFALGSTARNSREPDFVALRKKMHGLICELDASGSNNAFIMNLGTVVVVEFGDAGALYGYAHDNVPFDTKRILRLPVEGRNSLKQRAKAVMRESHHGAADSWNPWERNFEEQLRRKFGILPDSALQGARPIQKSFVKSAHSSDSEYSREALKELAQGYGLVIDDKTDKGGNLWVRGVGEGGHAARMLASWGFTHRPEKGWWK
jgi:hypothetical protein